MSAGVRCCVRWRPIPIACNLLVCCRRIAAVDCPWAHTSPSTPHRARSKAMSPPVPAVRAWVTLSRPDPASTVASDHLALAPAAHGKDVVTVILADFRGFDTMGEITVIGIAFIGLLALLRGRRGAA